VIRAATILCALTLAACANENDVTASPTAPEPAKIGSAGTSPVPTAGEGLNLADFVVPWICPDGRPEIVEGRCGAHPQAVQDVQAMRFHDLPGSNSTDEAYQVGGGWTLGANRYVAIYSYSPWREWRLPDDGGEVYAVEGDHVRAVMTQDGGKPYLQVFQGPECGGDGWMLFWSDAPTGRWAERVVRLAIGKEGDPCHPMGQSLTRYRVEQVPWTLFVDGKPETHVERTVVVQHYDRETIAKSQAMEEFYLVRHAGRLRWSSYTTSAPRGADLSLRCPSRPYTGDSDPRFRLNDCRDLTNLRSDSEAMTGERYGWPS
jgi:hypothetical protein